MSNNAPGPAMELEVALDILLHEKAHLNKDRSHFGTSEALAAIGSIMQAPSKQVVKLRGDDDEEELAAARMNNSVAEAPAASENWATASLANASKYSHMKAAISSTPKVTDFPKKPVAFIRLVHYAARSAESSDIAAYAAAHFLSTSEGITLWANFIISTMTDTLQAAINDKLSERARDLVPVLAFMAALLKQWTPFAVISPDTMRMVEFFAAKGIPWLLLLVESSDGEDISISTFLSLHVALLACEGICNDFCAHVGSGQLQRYVPVGGDEVVWRDLRGQCVSTLNRAFTVIGGGLPNVASRIFSSSRKLLVNTIIGPLVDERMAINTGNHTCCQMDGSRAGPATAAAVSRLVGALCTSLSAPLKSVRETFELLLAAQTSSYDTHRVIECFGGRTAEAVHRVENVVGTSDVSISTLGMEVAFLWATRSESDLSLSPNETIDDVWAAMLSNNPSLANRIADLFSQKVLGGVSNMLSKGFVEGNISDALILMDLCVCLCGSVIKDEAFVSVHGSKLAASVAEVWFPLCRATQVGTAQTLFTFFTSDRDIACGSLLQIVLIPLTCRFPHLFVRHWCNLLVEGEPESVTTSVIVVLQSLVEGKLGAELTLLSSQLLRHLISAITSTTTEWPTAASFMHSPAGELLLLISSEKTCELLVEELVEIKAICGDPMAAKPAMQSWLRYLAHPNIFGMMFVRALYQFSESTPKGTNERLHMTAPTNPSDVGVYWAACVDAEMIAQYEPAARPLLLVEALVVFWEGSGADKSRVSEVSDFVFHYESAHAERLLSELITRLDGAGDLVEYLSLEACNRLMAPTERDERQWGILSQCINSYLSVCKIAKPNAVVISVIIRILNDEIGQPPHRYGSIRKVSADILCATDAVDPMTWLPPVLGQLRSKLMVVSEDATIGQYASGPANTGLRWLHCLCTVLAKVVFSNSSPRHPEWLEAVSGEHLMLAAQCYEHVMSIPSSAYSGVHPPPNAVQAACRDFICLYLAASDMLNTEAAPSAELDSMSTIQLNYLYFLSRLDIVCEVVKNSPDSQPLQIIQQPQSFTAVQAAQPSQLYTKLLSSWADKHLGGLLQAIEEQPATQVHSKVLMSYIAQAIKVRDCPTAAPLSESHKGAIGRIAHKDSVPLETRTVLTSVLPLL